MVAKVTGHQRQPRNPMTRVLVDMCQRLPWERLLVTGGAIGAVSGAEADRVAGVGEAPKPGCAAADACVLVQGYLDGLSRGNGGFGVLALGKIRLEEGATSAAAMGQSQLAAEIQAVAIQLPAVRTREDAARTSQQLRPVADKAWRLGRICGLTLKK